MLKRILSLIFTLIPMLAAAQVRNTFDKGLEGWLITGDNSCEWQPIQGNPGGCLDVNDWASGDLNVAVAPHQFLGDWSNMPEDTILSLDYRFSNEGGSIFTQHIFEISGPGGTARSSELYSPPPTDLWRNYEVDLNPAHWNMLWGSWTALTANITSLRVAAEFVDGDESLMMDNISLSMTPIQVFADCLTATFSKEGTGDWSFSGTSSSNPGIGGNPGGFVALEDDSNANTYAYVPSRFLGDWSTLDGSGKLSVDIRVFNSQGINRGAPEFVTISGSGGVAHYPLYPGEVPDNPLEWRRIEIPIDGSLWTVDEGSWTEILQSVDTCRLDLEFFDGPEDVGFDNFSRLSSSCSLIIFIDGFDSGGTSAWSYTPSR